MQRWCAVLLLALACSGCVRSTILVTLRPDGSGTIDQTMGATPQAMAMIKGFGQAGGRQGAGAASDPFDLEQAKKQAAEMGVRFVSAEPIKTAEMEGFRAQYAFEDITKLKMNMQPGAGTGLSSGRSQSDETPFGFEFRRGPSSSVLTIRMPEQKPGSPGPFAGMSQMPGGRGGDPAETQQAMAMMKMMMHGLYVDVSLGIEGRIIKTNAPFVQGSKLTLLQLDFDKLLADEAALQKLQRATDIKTLKDVPGLKVVADPTVTVEFAR